MLECFRLIEYCCFNRWVDLYLLLTFILFIGAFNFASSQREFVLTEKVGSKQNVGLITLNRPKALNALCDALMHDLSDAINEFENDKTIGALIITGQGKAFAAGKMICS